jgi:hypothetical protein
MEEEPPFASTGFCFIPLGIPTLQVLSVKKSSGNPQGSNPGSNTKTTIKPDTDKIVLDICNNLMKVTPPISVDDIERSNIIGPVHGGYGHILCKFKCWEIKTRVFTAKSNLKHHRSTGFKVFLTEDITRKRQFMVQQLDQVRKDKKTESFWNSDGRILYKNNPKDRVRSIRSMNDIDYLLPNPTDEIVENA